MADIVANNLSKNFTVYHKEAGLVNSIISLFKRKYESKSALTNFNLEVKEGEIIGLLGPNGAGKTTFMKTCTGIVVPSSGELTVLGYIPHERRLEFRRNIALVMGQKSQLWWDLPAIDSLRLLKEYYELSKSQFNERLDLLTESLNVSNLLSLHVRKLSLGERMKMELLACLLHNPKIIFLDEPTIGLDVVAQNSIRNFLIDYHKKHNCTIILTSHYMADVEALCKRIVLLISGKKIFDGTSYEFEKLLGREKFVNFSFETEVDTKTSIFSKYKATFSNNNKNVELRIPEKELRAVAQDILKNFPVIDFQTEKLPIERVLKNLILNNK